MIRPSVVLGCPRSGTTFLMSVLNALPTVECMNGTLLPVTIPHIARQPLSPEIYQALAVGFERALDDYLHSGRYDSRAAALQKWAKSPTGLAGLIRATKLPREKPEMIVYKEPFLAFAPQFTLDALPDARIIHIYRDGRDCANSLRRKYDVLTDEKLRDLTSAEMRLGRRVDDRWVPWWVDHDESEQFLASTPYVRAMWMWKVMVQACHEAFSQPEVKLSRRVLSIRYEDFVCEPKAYGQMLLNHLEVDESRSFWKRLEKARTSSIGRHQQGAASDEEVRAAESLARSELSLYGYPLESETPTAKVTVPVP